MYLRIIIGLIIASMGGALWYTIDANAQAQADLQHQKARADGLVQQIAGVAEAYERRLKSQQEAYRVRDSHRETADSRREAAEDRYELAGSEAHAWGGSPAPAAVADSLCLKPGSCTGELPGTSGTSGGSDEADPGDATERTLRLENGDLREGIEALRHDLADCNADKAGMCEWCVNNFGAETCRCEVTP